MTRRRVATLAGCLLCSLVYVASCLIRTEDQDALVVVQVLSLIGAVWGLQAWGYG